jgi:hypothetical protein
MMLLDSIRKGTIAVAAVATLTASNMASAWTPPTFPRIGGVQIGSPQNYNDATYQANLAKQDIMILGDWPGFAPNGMPFQTVVTSIKAKNPNALVFAYVNSNEAGPTKPANSTSWGDYRAKLDQMKWWLYSDANQSAIVSSSFGVGYNAINITPYSPKDSSGNNAMEWITRFYVSKMAAPAPALDGFFMDNVFWRPYIDGDWNRDGKLDSQTNATVQSWWRQGFARYFALVKQLMPGKYQLGNVGDWGDPASQLSEYQNMANGGVLEAFIGKSWSVETWGGWANMKARYARVMANIAAPKLAIFNIWGVRTDYQTMRYGLGTCLLDDAYFSFTENSAGYSGVVWFDEYDQKLGAGQAKPSAAWQKGVWRRDFDNGIVLVNPKGNGAQTVTLEGPFVKFHGTQDPVTNNGQTVTTVTLKDRDGIILLRQKPITRPSTPTGFTVEH